MLGVASLFDLPSDSPSSERVPIPSQQQRLEAHY